MTPSQPGERISFRVVETPEIPVLGAFFGWLATAPFALGAALAWGLEGGAASLAARLTILWGAAILAFLAGVRRGLGFRAPGGPSTATVATMLGLFLLALGALVVPWPAAATALLLAGYGALAIARPHRRAPPRGAIVLRAAASGPDARSDRGARRARLAAHPDGLSASPLSRSPRPCAAPSGSATR